MMAESRLSLLKLAVLGIFLALTLDAQTTERLNQLRSALPDMLSAILAEAPYKTQYDLSDVVNPFYLEGDYDGDKHLDYVVMLTDRNTSAQRGFLFLASRKEPFLLYDSTKIDHHPLDAWINCHWADCGKLLFIGKATPQGRLIRGADVIMLRFGGPDVLWFWDGKSMRTVSVPGE